MLRPSRIVTPQSHVLSIDFYSMLFNPYSYHIFAKDGPTSVCTLYVAHTSVSIQPRCQGVYKGVSTEIRSQTSPWLPTYTCNPLHHFWWEFWCVCSSTSTFSNNVVHFIDAKCLKNAETGNGLKVFEPTRSPKHLYPIWANHLNQDPFSDFQEAKELGS